jgi:hypothetical protein
MESRGPGCFVWDHQNLVGFDEHMKGDIWTFVAERPASLAHLFAWWNPSSPGAKELLPGGIGEVAVATGLRIKKGLHIGTQPTTDPWVTGELWYQVKGDPTKGEVRHYWTTVHLHQSGAEKRVWYYPDRKKIVPSQNKIVSIIPLCISAFPFATRHISSCSSRPISFPRIFLFSHVSFYFLMSPCMLHISHYSFVSCNSSHLLVILHISSNSLARLPDY